MSVEALTWALNDAKVSGTDKVVLIGIANHAGPDDDGWAGWVHVDRLARYANVDARTVQRSIVRLEELGLISRQVHGGGSPGRCHPSRRPNRYQIHPSWGDASDVTPTSPHDAHVTSPGDAHVTPPPDASVTPIEPSVEPSVARPLAIDFDSFWKAYPKRIAKVAAAEAWTEAVEAGASPSQIVAGAERWARYCGSTATEPRFIPNPANWLAQRRWADDLDPAMAALPADRDPAGPPCNTCSDHPGLIETEPGVFDRCPDCLTLAAAP
jgi:hypothetical protein